MRRIWPGDLAAAERVLRRVPPPLWAKALGGMLDRAHCADKAVRRIGHDPAGWGDGSLGACARAHDSVAQPSDPVHWPVIRELIAEWRAGRVNPARS